MSKERNNYLSHDHTQATEITSRLRDSIQRLHDMSGDVAVARQVKEFASDRRKNLLARYSAQYTMSLSQGLSQAAAESRARCNPDYLNEFESLAEQCLNSERAIATFQAEMCRYEALRSLLSFSKTTMDVLQG